MIWRSFTYSTRRGSIFRFHLYLYETASTSAWINPAAIFTRRWTRVLMRISVMICSWITALAQRHSRDLFIRPTGKFRSLLPMILMTQKFAVTSCGLWKYRHISLPKLRRVTGQWISRQNTGGTRHRVHFQMPGTEAVTMLKSMQDCRIFANHQQWTINGITMLMI